MFKLLKPLKDSYITNRIINGARVLNSNVGSAGSLDLYKLYGYTFTTSGSSRTPNVELTRLLIGFDLTPLRDLISQGIIDITNPSFSCKLHMHDVYGGQPTPSNFTVSVFPLSASFDEGLGRDVVNYSDYDVCNFLTASSTAVWHLSGCGQASTGSSPCDYVSASLQGASYRSDQIFVTGEEDLDVDVTAVVSATLAGIIPDNGFRISLASSLEDDTKSYFVKRFASRTAFNEDLRPKMYVRFDDSIQDDTNNVFLDTTSYLFMYNYVRSTLTNLTSGSTHVTGSNSLILQLNTPVSGGVYSLFFSGSQHAIGHNAMTGVYSASILVSSTDANTVLQWQTSGSITFTPIWRSLDSTVSFLTGSVFTAYPPTRGPQALDPKAFTITILGLSDTHDRNEQVVLRANIFDRTSPYLLRVIKLPVELPGSIIRDVHYQVRDVNTGRIAIPFDTVTNSTRISNDSAGMYFKLDMTNLTVNHSYVIDVEIVAGNNKHLFRSVSAAFRVE